MFSELCDKFSREICLIDYILIDILVSVEIKRDYMNLEPKLGQFLKDSFLSFYKYNMIDKWTSLRGLFEIVNRLYHSEFGGKNVEEIKKRRSSILLSV